MPPTLADPEELMTLSPSAIRGPSDAEWFSLGQSRDYRGQHALQAQALNRFKKYWQIWYVKRLRTVGKLTDAVSPLKLGEVVLITDLKSTSIRSNPHLAVGRISVFMDNDRSQAITSYAGGSVNRPIESLVVLVRKDEQIDEKGLCFDPLVRADKELNQVLELEDQLEDEDEKQHVDVEEEVDVKKEDGPQEELETSEEDQPKAGQTVQGWQGGKAILAAPGKKQEEEQPVPEATAH